MLECSMKLRDFMENEKKKYRNWCWTLNNYTKEEMERIQNQSTKYLYCCFGQEKGESGTPHLQGYIRFRNGTSLKCVKDLLSSRAHIEPRRGTEEQAIKYCEKDGAFTEIGTRAEPGKRTDLIAVSDAIRKGSNMQCIAEEFPTEYIKYNKGINAYRNAIFSTPRDSKPIVFWLWGDTGSGKSRACVEFCKELNYSSYWKDNTSKWWDGYDNQDVVIIDDIRTKTFEFHYLLRLIDRYPLLVEFKGGMININTKIFIFTCPLKPEDIYMIEEDKSQLLRRIDYIYELNKN